MNTDNTIKTNEDYKNLDIEKIKAKARTRMFILFNMSVLVLLSGIFGYTIFQRYKHNQHIERSIIILEGGLLIMSVSLLRILLRKSDVFFVRHGVALSKESASRYKKAKTE